jgi:carbonic anhydrase
MGLIDNWLRHVQDVADRHETLMREAGDEAACIDRLCELNVIEQVRNVCNTTVIADAWRRGQRVAVHGWIYALHDGLLRDLGFTVSGLEDVDAACRRALSDIARTALRQG